MKLDKEQNKETLYQRGKEDDRSDWKKLQKYWLKERC